MTFIVLSKEGCVYCDKAKSFLERNALTFTTRSCLDIDDARNILISYGISSKHVASFPQIVELRDDQYRLVGGYEHLLDYMEEPLLRRNPNRFTPFPIVYRDMWDMYKKGCASFWTADEVSLAQDVKDWEGLTKDEQHFVKHVLAFFANSDGIVAENLASNFCIEIQIPEARQFYSYQIFNEAIHCVSGSTRLLTSSGYYPIANLENKTMSIWNGEEYCDVKICKTGKDKLMRITLSNGMTLDCTEKHEWILAADSERRKAKDLHIGDPLAPYTLPVMNLKDPCSMPDAYKHGTTSGSFVPLNYSLSTKLEWLEGFVDRWGEAQGTKQLRIVHTSREMLCDVQLMMSTMGVMATLQPSTTDDDSWELCGHLDEKPELCVARIEKLTEEEDTFCFNEPKKHSGVFAGILTGQSEQYGLLIDALISDPNERAHLFNAIRDVPSVQKKAAWAMKWLNPSKRFAERLVAYICVEGILFSGSFCAIYWLKYRGILPGLGLSNEFISRDEALHQTFGELLYKHLKRPLQEQVVKDIIQEAVENEKEFIIDAIPCAMIGMNSELMSQYIEFVADRILVALGYSKLYNSQNPFGFMELISLSGKTNFFERFVSEYQRAGVLNAPEDQMFALDEKF